MSRQLIVTIVDAFAAVSSHRVSPSPRNFFHGETEHISLPQLLSRLDDHLLGGKSLELRNTSGFSILHLECVPENYTYYSTLSTMAYIEINYMYKIAISLQYNLVMFMGDVHSPILHLKDYLDLNNLQMSSVVYKKLDLSLSVKLHHD